MDRHMVFRIPETPNHVFYCRKKLNWLRSRR